MGSYITAIGTATPGFRYDQMKIADFMADAVSLEGKERLKLMALYKASGIKKRSSVVPDFGLENGEYRFFPNTPDLEPFPTVSERMALYQKEALPLAVEAVNDCLGNSSTKNEDVTHLITVSCTGMYAPGIDLDLVESLGLSRNVIRTCVNFMGCYAAFNALKVADAFCKADPEAKVLIVSIELCTIHYQKKKDWDHLLSNALFSDGAAATLVQGKPTEDYNLQLGPFYCDIEPEGSGDMAWHISNHGFEMTLSSYVPELVKTGIKSLSDSLLKKVSAKSSDIDFYAIHPGGRRILEVIEDQLDLDRENNKYAYKVLKDNGNMSSATILFVLKELMMDLQDGDYGKNVLSFAFGPGLTLESMLLTVTPIASEHVSINSSRVLSNV